MCADADHALIQEMLTFVLVGAGTVGVELASTIAEMARMALAHDFRHLDPGAAQIMLFDGAPRILPSFAEDLSAKAHRHLQQLGVKIFTGTRVEKVDAEGIVADGKRIRSRTVLWTAGVTASPAARWLGAEADKSGRVKVNSDLSVPGHARSLCHWGHCPGVRKYAQPDWDEEWDWRCRCRGWRSRLFSKGKYVAELIRRRTAGQSGPGTLLVLGQG